MNARGIRTFTYTLSGFVRRKNPASPGTHLHELELHDSLLASIEQRRNHLKVLDQW
jgi:hypothetical protein